MTNSILNESILLRNQPPEKLQEYLREKLIDIFDPIFKNAAKIIEAQQTVLFILCAYSEDSPLLVLRRDTDEEKEGICEYLNIPDYMRGKLKQLTDSDTRKATTEYIRQFAAPTFKALKLMEIQMEDLNMAITNREYLVEKEDGEIKISLYDFKEHTKAVAQYELLCKRKDALEKELKNTVQYKGLSEMKEYKFQNIDKKLSKGTGGISLENSKYIKLGDGRTRTN